MKYDCPKCKERSVAHIRTGLDAMEFYCEREPVDCGWSKKLPYFLNTMQVQNLSKSELDKIMQLSP